MTPAEIKQILQENDREPVDEVIRALDSDRMAGRSTSAGWLTLLKIIVDGQSDEDGELLVFKQVRRNLDD